MLLSTPVLQILVMVGDNMPLLVLVYIVIVLLIQQTLPRYPKLSVNSMIDISLSSRISRSHANSMGSITVAWAHFLNRSF